MNATPELIIAPDAAGLAGDVAARVLTTLRQAQDERGRAAIALTAGSIMEQIWSSIAASEDAGVVDWSRVDVYWADERFVPFGADDRNDTAANRIWFSHLPFSAVAQYAAPASDGEYGADLDAAAAGYQRTLAAARRPDDTGGIPSVDVLLLGVGPDGHCASLFPDHPSSRDDSALVIAVRDSPKPPPLRLSFSFAGLNTAREIWVVASGDGKADAVAKALAEGADRTHVPSAGARGQRRTLWLIDQDAAAELPG